MPSARGVGGLTVGGQHQGSRGPGQPDLSRRAVPWARAGAPASLSVGVPFRRMKSHPLPCLLPGGVRSVCSGHGAQHSHVLVTRLLASRRTPVTARQRGVQAALRRVGGHEQTCVHAHSASCRSVLPPSPTDSGEGWPWQRQAHPNRKLGISGCQLPESRLEQ